MAFAFMSQNRFLAVPHHQNDTVFGIAGVPYDGAVTNRHVLALRQFVAPAKCCVMVHTHTLTYRPLNT